MSSAPVPSALDASTQTFPTLKESQIARIRTIAKSRQVRVGEVLFEPGDEDVPFFVVISGEMEIVQPDMRGHERQITTHVRGGFTGEMTMISGRRSLVLGRVIEAGEFLELSGADLRHLIARDSELSEIFMRAFILRRLRLVSNSLGNLVLLGSRYSARSLELREFLTRNGHPYMYVDLDTDKDAQSLLDEFKVRVDEIPVTICNRNQVVMRNPTVQKLADCLGLSLVVDPEKVRDLIIVGAGPSGLAAAVYAASEGLDVLLIETALPGGQAASSSKIENYLGFPTGLAGQELAARAIAQAEKFGAKMMVAHSVVRLDCDKHPYYVILDDGRALPARSLVISTGAQYKRPELPNLKGFEGQGVYYGATRMEAQICDKEDVVVVGGANSAGQAAVFLAENGCKVYMLVRGKALSDTMSRYLIERIEQNPAIELHCQTEITALEGNGHLQQVTWKNKGTGESEAHPIRHVFIMAGAMPRTDWLQGCLALDEKGFILTGRDLDGIENRPWKLARRPQMLETSLPGVFAVGDVRSGSVKRVASAVGEGAIAIQLVHQVLGEF